MRAIITLTQSHYQGKAYPVYKEGTLFYIPTTDKPNNIVGFSSTKQNRYTRNSNYTYIYNPNEVKY